MANPITMPIRPPTPPTPPTPTHQFNYSISILINLKNNNNISYYTDLIKDAGKNTNSTHTYEDYDFEGINNYIKKQNTIITLEFDETQNLCNFIKFTKLFRDLTIESIYDNNKILHATKQALNSVNKTLHSKEALEATIANNMTKPKYADIYNNL